MFVFPFFMDKICFEKKSTTSQIHRCVCLKLQMLTPKVKSYIPGKKDHFTQSKSQKNLQASSSTIWLDKQYLVRRLNLTQVGISPMHGCNPARWLQSTFSKYLFLFPLHQPSSDKFDVLKWWWIAFFKLILQPCAHKDLSFHGISSFVCIWHK